MGRARRPSHSILPRSRAEQSLRASLDPARTYLQGGGYDSRQCRADTQLAMIGVSMRVTPKGIWTPYSWQLPRRFALAETNLCPQRWPNNLPPLRVLLLSDIHTGPFLKPEVLSTIVTDLMALRPDLVVIAGDIVTGHSSELDNFLAGLAVLSEAPLGAWFCLGNHDHFKRRPRRRSGTAGVDRNLYFEKSIRCADSRRQQVCPRRYR